MEIVRVVALEDCDVEKEENERRHGEESDREERNKCEFPTDVGETVESCCNQ